jgi:FkbM family methyltransferase
MVDVDRIESAPDAEVLPARRDLSKKRGVDVAEARPTSRDLSKKGGIDVHRIRGQTILVCNPRARTNIEKGIGRLRKDHFLTQLCIFQENDIVVDIGADVGIGAIHLAKMFPSIKVYAVEPDGQKFKQMKRNIELNSVENVHPLNVAVGGITGNSRLFSALDGEWSTINPRFALQRKSFTVQETEVTTIGNLFQELGIRDCRMLKISAWGSVKDIVTSIPSSTTVDYLTGDAHRDDCESATLETASWHHSRQHSWRIWWTTHDGPTSTIAHQPPSGPTNDSQVKPRTRTRLSPPTVLVSTPAGTD